MFSNEAVLWLFLFIKGICSSDPLKHYLVLGGMNPPPLAICHTAQSRFELFRDTEICIGGNGEKMKS